MGKVAAVASFAVASGMAGLALAEEPAPAQLSVDHGVEAAIRKANPSYAKPARPIRTLVIEQKSRAAAGTEFNVVVECHYEPGELGVLRRACEQRGKGGPASGKVTTTDLAYMGLTPALLSTSGTPNKIQAQGVVTRWDADFAKMAHPAEGAAWTDSSNISWEFSVSSLFGKKDQRTVSATRRCVAGKRSPAAGLNPKLAGDYLPVDCTGQVAKDDTFVEHWAYLAESGLYVQTASKNSRSEGRYRIVEVEYY